MNRANKYILISHCLLNVNSKVKGYGIYSGVLKSLIIPLIEEGYGIVQLPCPETTFAGIKRWGMTVEQYDTPSYRRHCSNLLSPFLDQIEDDLRNNVHIEGIVGVDGSPSCGVCKTCYGYCGGMIGSGDYVSESIEKVHLDSGEGVFIATLKSLMEKRGIFLPMVGIDEENPNNSSWNFVKEKLKEERML